MKRVLEIGQVVAGPTAGLILSDLGYEVIKIERPITGDISRKLSGSSSGTFPYYNRNKKSLTLDFTKEEGKEILKKLIETSDIIIENLGPGSMEKLGFSYEEVKKINDKMIYLSIKGYMNGPYENRKSLDYPVEIESGIAYMTGLNGKPMRLGGSIIDMTAAMVGIIEIMDKILKNTGGYIKIGLFETAMFLIGQHIATYQLENRDLGPINEENFAWGVYDLFTSSDNKKIFIAISTDSQWKSFCKAFNFDYKKEYETNNQRYNNRNILVPEIQRLLINMDSQNIIKKLGDYNISYGLSNKPWDLLRNEHAMKYMVPEIYKNKEISVPVMPFYSGKNNYVPELGDYNIKILKSIGYNDSDLNRFKAQNII